MTTQRHIQPDRRAASLAGARRRKMARSIHAYIRGTVAQFYERMAESSIELPEAPALWICGDCHIGNLGPLADDNGHVSIQIRDFDQTTLSHPAYDLCRLGFSLAILARSSDLPGLATVRLLEALADGYASALSDHPPGLTRELPPTLRLEVRKAHNKSWKTLARERTAGHTVSLPRGRSFWPITADEHEALRTLFARPDVAGLATQISRRPDQCKVSLLDAAFWRKGCSSLGRRRYAAVLDVDGEGRKGNDFCLMDVKEAHASCVPAMARGVPVQPAERLLAGARALTPALGERMRAGDVLGTPVIVRELMPQDMKLDIRRLQPNQAQRMADYLGAVVGYAHARQLSTEDRQAWHRKWSADAARRPMLPRGSAMRPSASCMSSMSPTFSTAFATSTRWASAIEARSRWRQPYQPVLTQAAASTPWPAWPHPESASGARGRPQASLPSRAGTSSALSRRDCLLRATACHQSA